MHRCNLRRTLGLVVLVAGVFLGTNVLFTPPVLAAECPADQKKENVRAAPSDQVGRGKIAVHEQHHRYDHRDDRRDQAPGRHQGPIIQTASAEVEPGGIVPWHNHADRPAIAYLLEGKLTEYASNCAVPVEHTAGDASLQTPNLSHWWKNFGAVSRRHFRRSLEGKRRQYVRARAYVAAAQVRAFRFAWQCRKGWCITWDSVDHNRDWHDSQHASERCGASPCRDNS